ncbi:hypothetical protein F5148DRAFT_1200755, partial [Russula earlei]
MAWRPARSGFAAGCLPFSVSLLASRLGGCAGVDKAQGGLRPAAWGKGFRAIATPRPSHPLPCEATHRGEPTTDRLPAANVSGSRITVTFGSLFRTGTVSVERSRASDSAEGVCVCGGGGDDVRFGLFV